MYNDCPPARQHQVAEVMRNKESTLPGLTNDYSYHPRLSYCHLQQIKGFTILYRQRFGQIACSYFYSQNILENGQPRNWANWSVNVRYPTIIILSDIIIHGNFIPQKFSLCSTCTYMLLWWC